MASLRVRNLNDHLTLNEGSLVAQPGASQSLENRSAAGAIAQQMVPPHGQLSEVVNAQAPYPSQQVMQQQMAGGPGRESNNARDHRLKGEINGLALQDLPVRYLDRFILGLSPNQGAVLTGGLEAAGAMAARRPNL